MQNKPKRPRCIIRITLQDTLLGQKYCIHKLLKRQGYCFTYQSINISNSKPYIVKLYRLDQIQEDDQMYKDRYRIFKKMQILNSINSPYLIHCYKLYQNISYMAVVYQYIKLQHQQIKQINNTIKYKSLAYQIDNNKINKDQFQLISKHIFQGMDALREAGYSPKNVDLDQIFLSNGYYKIVDFSIFSSQKSKTQQKNKKIIQICQKQKVITDDVWTFGILFLKLVTSTTKFNSIIQNMSTNNISLYTPKFQRQTQQTTTVRQKQVLKKCLMMDIKNRMKWQQLKKQFLKNKYNSQSNKPHKIIQQIDQSKQTSQVNFGNTFSNNNNISKFTFRNLQKQDLTNYKNRLKTHQQNHQQQQKLFQSSFKIEKSNFILNRIIKPIQQNKMIDIQKRSGIQFIYILSLQCLTRISQVKSFLEQEKAKQKQASKQNNYEQNQQQQTLQKSAQKSYLISQKYFNQYGKNLTKSENAFLNRAKDFWGKISDKQKQQQKNKYLNGFIGCDYKRQQLITYIQQNYINQFVLKQLSLYTKSIKNQKTYKISSQITEYLKNYQQIVGFPFNPKTQIIKGKQFQDYLNVFKNKSNKSQFN